jgi:hypothetical protein
MGWGSAPMAAGLARRRPPIVATQPAATQQRSSRTLLALVALVALLACRLPHRTRLLGGGWRACTDLCAALQPTPTKDAFQHLARPHGHTATPHAAARQRHYSHVFVRTSATAGIPPSSWRVLCAPCPGCTRLSMSLDPCHSSGAPHPWSFLSHTPRPPHPPDWPLPPCDTAATIAVNTTLLAGDFPVVAHASSSPSCPCRAA